ATVRPGPGPALPSPPPPAGPGRARARHLDPPHRGRRLVAGPDHPGARDPVLGVHDGALLSAPPTAAAGRGLRDLAAPVARRPCPGGAERLLARPAGRPAGAARDPHRSPPPPALERPRRVARDR